MSLSKEEVNKIKHQAIVNRRVQEIEKIANLEVEISSCRKRSLSGEQGTDQAINAGNKQIADVNKFIVVLDEEIKKYEGMV